MLIHIAIKLVSTNNKWLASNQQKKNTNSNAFSFTKKFELQNGFRNEWPITITSAGYIVDCVSLPDHSRSTVTAVIIFGWLAIVSFVTARHLKATNKKEWNMPLEPPALRNHPHPHTGRGTDLARKEVWPLSPP